MARYVAKNIVAAGLADRCQLQVAYAIGTAHPVSLMIETFDTATVDPEIVQKAVWEIFDFRPAAIIRDLDLARPIYGETAAYGHFGRRSSPGRPPIASTRSAAPSAPEVLAGPVAVCIDRPLLALDKPFTYDLPAELGAGIGSYVRSRFHGKLTKGWVLGPTDDIPSRTLPVQRAVSPVRFFDPELLELAKWISARYVTPLAEALGALSPPRVAWKKERAPRRPRGCRPRRTAEAPRRSGGPTRTALASRARSRPAAGARSSCVRRPRTSRRSRSRRCGGAWGRAGARW